MEHLLHLISRLFHPFSFFLMTQDVCGRAPLAGAAKQPVTCSSGSRKPQNVVATATDRDAEVVMRRLRLWDSSEEEEDGGGGFMEAACRLLQEKEASVEELEEAFAVFDGNGDGKVGAEELMRVMERLGLEEGVRLGDCERMIAVYDEDGDGAISFREFKNMLMDSS